MNLKIKPLTEIKNDLEEFNCQFFTLNTPHPTKFKINRNRTLVKKSWSEKKKNSIGQFRTRFYYLCFDKEVLVSII